MKAFTKFLFVLTLIVPGLLMVSCNDDDDDPEPQNECSISDFVGSYGGTYDGDMISVTIQQQGSNLEMEVTQGISTETFTFLASEINDCDLMSSSQNIDAFNLTLNGDNLSGTLNGDNFNITKGQIVEPQCDIQDFVGTYTGTFDGQSVNVSIVIDEDGDLEIDIDEVDEFYYIFPEEIDGCNAVGTGSNVDVFNLTLNEDNLSGTLDGKALDITKGTIVVPDCMQSDWVGSYSGTIDCDGDQSNVEMTITAAGAEGLIIAYTTSDGTEADYEEPLNPDGCNIDQTIVEGNVSLSVDASLDGVNLSFQEIITVDGQQLSSCNITATRN